MVRESRVAVSDSLPVIELASTSESGTRRALGISIPTKSRWTSRSGRTRSAPAAAPEPYIEP